MKVLAKHEEDWNTSQKELQEQKITGKLCKTSNQIKSDTWHLQPAHLCFEPAVKNDIMYMYILCIYKKKHYFKPI